jgi:hypothetical protein
MKNNCKRCAGNSLPLYPNKLCQRCLSSDLENSLLRKGKQFFISSEILIDRYLIKKMSIDNIALEFNSTRSKITKNLKQFRIPIRSKSRYFNENIFSKMTLEGAFLLGFIFTDGDLLLNGATKKYFLRIYSKHKVQIEKIRTILKTDAKIQHRAQKNFGNLVQGEIYILHIGNQSIISDLMGYGLTINKKATVKFPDIPDNLKHHFIRGCWAGSGNVSIYKSSVSSSIIIGSHDFITEIEKFLNENGLKKRNVHKLKLSKNPSYLIKYAHNESEKLYNLLYKGKSNLTISSKQEKIYMEYFKKQDCNRF